MPPSALYLSGTSESTSGLAERGGGRTWPSSAALHREMIARGRGCKAYHGRHVVWHRHSCLCPMYGRHPSWSQARVPVPHHHRSEHARLMAMPKPLRTRGQMTSRGGGQSTSTSVLPAPIDLPPSPLPVRTFAEDQPLDRAQEG